MHGNIQVKTRYAGPEAGQADIHHYKWDIYVSCQVGHLHKAYKNLTFCSLKVSQTGMLPKNRDINLSGHASNTGSQKDITTPYHMI